MPLAYLITFRCYGTWLHGDVRGSVDYAHNIYGTPFLATDDKRKEEEQRRLKQLPVRLDEAHRIVVDKAVREVCCHRGWTLLAINVRTNHVHVVVSAGCESKKVLNDFKVYATRRMREAGVWKGGFTPWAKKGSRRYLWTEQQVERACNYVINHQGDDLIPSFTDHDDPGVVFVTDDDDDD